VILDWIVDQVELAADFISSLQHKRIKPELVTPQSRGYSGGTSTNDDYVVHFDSEAQACARCKDSVAMMLAISSGE